MDDTYFKLPRLFTDQPLQDKGVIGLEDGQAHYLFTVLRQKNGKPVRLFNGKDGEWLGTLENTGKKTGQVIITKQLKPQPEQTRRLHAFFCPIKKHRMDWMIEKAVELGVTDFHPVLSQNTEIRKINRERIEQQIFEAAEQCERFEIPVLHEVQKLETALTNRPKDIPFYACIERFDAPALQSFSPQNGLAFLIGPEGGFTQQEKKEIDTHTTLVSLGETILRCETALIKALILLNP